MRGYFAWDDQHLEDSLPMEFRYTQVYRDYTGQPLPLRELKCLEVALPAAAAPLQEAVVTALEFGPEYYDWLRELYTAKRDLFCNGLDSLGLVHNVPQGAYYVMIDISQFGYEDDLAFCEDLAREVGVGAVPGSSFFCEPVNNLIRLHFAKRDDTLKAALENLSRIDRLMPR